MMNRHRLAHAALAGVHFALAIILAVDGDFPQAGCVSLAAAIYLTLAISRRQLAAWVRLLPRKTS